MPPKKNNNNINWKNGFDEGYKAGLAYNEVKLNAQFIDKTKKQIEAQNQTVIKAKVNEALHDRVKPYRDEILALRTDIYELCHSLNNYKADEFARANGIYKWKLTYYYADYIYKFKYWVSPTSHYRIVTMEHLKDFRELVKIDLMKIR